MWGSHNNVRKIQVFCDVLYRLVNSYQHFRGACCHHLQGWSWLYSFHCNYFNYSCHSCLLFQLLSMPEYQKSLRISVFISMDDEIQTDKIIQSIFQSRKTCFIPRYESICNTATLPSCQFISQPRMYIELNLYVSWWILQKNYSFHNGVQTIIITLYSIKF
jgi:hypothetical protein